MKSVRTNARPVALSSPTDTMNTPATVKSTSAGRESFSESFLVLLSNLRHQRT